MSVLAKDQPQPSQATKIQHEVLTKRIKEMLVNKCKVKAATIKKWFTKESYFDVERALEVGLVDRWVNNG